MPEDETPKPRRGCLSKVALGNFLFGALLLCTGIFVWIKDGGVHYAAIGSACGGFFAFVGSVLLMVARRP